MIYEAIPVNSQLKKFLFEVGHPLHSSDLLDIDQDEYSVFTSVGVQGYMILNRKTGAQYFVQAWADDRVVNKGTKIDLR